MFSRQIERYFRRDQEVAASWRLPKAATFHCLRVLNSLFGELSFPVNRISDYGPVPTRRDGSSESMAAFKVLATSSWSPPRFTTTPDFCFAIFNCTKVGCLENTFPTKSTKYHAYHVLSLISIGISRLIIPNDFPSPLLLLQFTQSSLNDLYTVFLALISSYRTLSLLISPCHHLLTAA